MDGFESHRGGGGWVEAVGSGMAMDDGLLIMEPDAGRRRVLDDYCGSRGYSPHSVESYEEFSRAWKPGLRMVWLSLPLASADGIEAIRFLGEQGCGAGLILSSDADPRVLSAASRLARGRGLRVLGSLQQPFSRADVAKLLLHPEPELAVQTMVMSVGMAQEDLRDCLRRGLVRPWFQPKIAVRSMEFVAVEALVRLEHPSRGVLRPSAFVALAEETGMIGEMTELVARETFSWCAQWHREGLPIDVSINISPLLISDLEFPNKLAAWADELGVRPESIILETTESWLNDESLAALDTLTRLRLRGFQLSIDDFGTGYSSIAQLHEIPYSEMKLDRRFVRTAAIDREARAIVESSIELGHKLGMRVVAEGVERQEDWDLISELGCDEGQGYFLARPMRGEGLGAWLTRWNSAMGMGRSEASGING